MARLVVRSGSERGREFALLPSQTLGRAEDNEIVIPDARMSRNNSRLLSESGHWFVEDLSSKNGTYVNGERVDRVRLEHDSELRIGETHFVFLDDEAAASAKAPAPGPGYTGAPVEDDPLQMAPIHTGVAGQRAPTASRAAGARAAERARHEFHTKTSFAWLRQDLAQADSSFRVLVFIGLALIAAAAYWLIQSLVAGA